MQVTVTVNAEVEREQGPFESRDTIEAAVVEAIEGADPGSIEGDNGGTYAVQSWEVEAEEVKPRKAKKSDLPGMRDSWFKLRQAVNAAVQMEREKDAGLGAQLDRIDRLTDGFMLAMERAGIGPGR